MINNDLVCEPLPDVSSRITSLACVLYRKYGVDRATTFYQDKIRVLLLMHEIENSENCDPEISEKIPGRSLAAFILDEQQLLLIFRKEAITRAGLEELKTFLAQKGIKAIMVIVLRQWGVTIRKVIIHSESR